MLNIKSVAFACCCLVALSPSWASADDIADIKKLDAEFGQSLVEGTGTWLKNNLADDFKIVLPSGDALNKQEYVERWTSDTFVVTSCQTRGIDVRLFGNVAIVIGHGPIKGEAYGKPFDEIQQWTEVFVKTDGKWKCVSCHVSNR
ncbi:nuclear transport factor 2 family protein [Roseiconus nitratireducens]|nr:nuclear transport factor 2 family protein [Roseiconus nitratireducens]